MIKLGTDYDLTTESKVYRFVTSRIIATPLPYSHKNVAFFDAQGRKWASIEGGTLYIAKGYAWNGCSPKRKVFGTWLGTPDTRSNVHASLVHDVLFQFSATDHLTLTFCQSNSIFHAIMRKDGFALADIYHNVVSEFGWSFWARDKTVKSQLL